MHDVSAPSTFTATGISCITAVQLTAKVYDFSINANSKIDGSSFETNVQGRVIGAMYTSGAAVKMNETCMIVRAEDWSLWFADSQKHFHPID
jgi:hypothetical protein